MDSIIQIKNLSKLYRLGTVGTGTLSNDLKRWWYLARGKEDPFIPLGAPNNRSEKSRSNFVWALRDINLQVRTGEILGIIGRNGAGKSTLLKILSKVTGPTEGIIEFNGRIGSLLEVGTGFHPELTGRENVFLNGAILGMTKREILNKLEEIVEFSGCERYIDTPVKRYSSGMKVRLGFAVAAHLEPEILVVDEVLAVGDAEFQKKAIGKMQDVSRSDHRTVLFVSHNMAAVQSLCDRGMVLDNGTVGFEGSTEDCVKYYLGGDSEKDDEKRNLENVTNRSGSGVVQFADFHIEDHQGQETNSVLTGNDVDFVFRLKVTEPNVRKIDLGFSIVNELGVRIGNLYSSYQHVLFDAEHEGYFTVRFQFKEFNFCPGRIYVGGLIKVDSLDSDRFKERLGYVDVDMGDYYGTGVSGQSNWGCVLFKGDWTRD